MESTVRVDRRSITIGIIVVVVDTAARTKDLARKNSRAERLIWLLTHWLEMVLLVTYLLIEVGPIH
jgi:hypothetical protein